MFLLLFELNILNLFCHSGKRYGYTLIFWPFSLPKRVAGSRETASWVYPVRAKWHDTEFRSDTCSFWILDKCQTCYSECVRCSSVGESYHSPLSLLSGSCGLCWFLQVSSTHIHLKIYAHTYTQRQIHTHLHMKTHAHTYKQKHMHTPMHKITSYTLAYEWTVWSSTHIPTSM